MNLIKTISVNKTRIRANATQASIKVDGEVGAIFSLQVKRSSDNRYYNFDTTIFEAIITSVSRLKNQSPGSFNIVIPAAAAGDTYTVYVWAEPHFNTEYTGSNKVLRTKTITQVANSTITFTAAGTGITDTAIGTSKGSIMDNFTSTGSPTVVMSDLQLTVPVATGNYGFFITTTNNDIDLDKGTWNSNALFWVATEANVGGTSGSSDQVVVADLTGLVVGMELTYIVGTTAPGSATTITAINTTTKTLTLSRNQAITAGDTMTFRAYGPRLIEQAIGIVLKLTNSTCRLGQESTVVHTAITSGTPTAVRVKGSQGVSKGATVRGKFVDNSSNLLPCSISGISVASTTDATITITQGVFDADTSDIRVNTILYVDGSSSKVYLNGTISITKYPNVNQTIFIDTTRILTKGTAS